RFAQPAPLTIVAGHLGGEEDLVSWQAGAAQRLAAFRFRTVALGRIEMPVTGVERMQDRLDTRVPRTSERAKSHRRYFVALSHRRLLHGPVLPGPLAFRLQCSRCPAGGSRPRCFDAASASLRSPSSRICSPANAGWSGLEATLTSGGFWFPGYIV